MSLIQLTLSPITQTSGESISDKIHGGRPTMSTCLQYLSKFIALYLSTLALP